MKASQIIFNAVSLLIAGFCLVTALSAFFVTLPGVSEENRSFFHFMITLLLVVMTFLGVGGVANFAKGRLALWPTGIMIAGYSISVWLFPFAIWGIILLLRANLKRQGMEQVKSGCFAPKTAGPEEGR